MKKTSVLVIFTIILGIILILFLYQNKSLEHEFKKNNIYISGIQDFVIVRLDTKNITAERDGETIRIEILKNINDQKAKEHIANRVALFSSLFEPQLPPYPEFLTKETGCAEKFRPVEKTTEHGNYYLVHAGKRFGYGICADDLIEYKAAFGFFYCPQEESVFKLEYFIPKNKNFSKLEKVIGSFSCI